MFTKKLVAAAVAAATIATAPAAHAASSDTTNATWEQNPDFQPGTAPSSMTGSSLADVTIISTIVAVTLKLVVDNVPQLSEPVNQLSSQYNLPVLPSFNLQQLSSTIPGLAAPAPAQ